MKPPPSGPRGCADASRTGGAASSSCGGCSASLRRGGGGGERKSDQGGGNRTQHGELFYNVFARIELNAKSNNDW